ncbi:hypothetical protein QTJ16_006884 [Diplocarpon rosae]|uniref:Clr5 domain-containing protein n=1 Tax=Diplocarpon rosae TaxID=946125 RepID=A0AAD9WAX3_9HELO|nr:hypothetical protein QTJ16_006884 [Diplocarpon rosae]
MNHLPGELMAPITFPRHFATGPSDGTMPRDWRAYRAEIERLYVKEKRPLEEVRHIFREEHGFNASMRAYQMRLDDWGLETDQADRASPHARSWSAGGLTSTSKNSLRSTTSAGPGRIRERRGSSSPEIGKAARFARLTRGPFDVCSAFERLLSRWHPGPDSTLRCFQHPDYKKWSKRSNPDHGPILFKLIEALVPPQEQFELNKAFLETDLRYHSDPSYPFHAWRCAWRRLLRGENSGAQPGDDEDDDGELPYGAEEWEHAKETLREDAVISQVAGEKFLDSALVVMAERRLTACRDHPHQRGNRRKYLNVLKDFRHMRVDVDPSFYKDSLRIIELETEESGEASRQDCWSSRDDLADEFRHKYLRLVNDCVQVERSGSGRSLPLHHDDPADLAAAPYPSPSTTHPVRNSEPPSTPIPRASASTSTNADASTVFQTLVAKWKTLDSFTEYAHSLLAVDGTAISFLLPAPPCPNLFAQIASRLPPTEQFALTSALLLAFSALPPTSLAAPSAWFLHWWSSVSASPSWATCLARLDLPRTTAHLEALMGPPAAKLFLDAAVLLVAEKLMLRIKDLLGQAKRRRDASPEARRRCKSWEGEYMDILRELYAREVRVDQAWTVYLTNVIF